ncbi:hypothetical protein [Nocardia sp. NPDC050710]|uniref:hypothetical protein n=1 Tax=Nocardia sp. NPDC050710 TaxID=3157220 RepID=UPI0034118C61
MDDGAVEAFSAATWWARQFAVGEDITRDTGSEPLDRFYKAATLPLDPPSAHQVDAFRSRLWRDVLALIGSPEYR